MSLRATIIHLLTTHRLPLSDEKQLQAAIAGVLKAAALHFAREVYLGPRDIVDFMVYPDPVFDQLGGARVGAAIEVKIKGNRRDIYRQVERYCGHAAVGEIVLATNVPMALPEFIDGKPTGIAALGRGWL